MTPETNIAPPDGRAAPRRTILLTTDGSPDSLTAVVPTLDLAQRLGARVLLLTVVCDAPTAPTMPPASAHAWKRDVEAEVAAARVALGQVAASMRTRLQSADVEEIVVRGESPEAVITSVAAVRGVAFIAMASHGRSGLRRMLLGSVTEQVIRRTRIPVIVFPVVA
jgi:nucleotide-binding universal stress UspA family protein